MISLTLDTWVSLAVIVTGLATLYAAMHRDLRRVEERLEAKIDRGDTRLETTIDALDTRIDALDTKLDTRIDALDTKLDTRIDALNTKLDTRIDALDTKLDALRIELKADIARLDDRVYALASGLRPLLEQAQRTD